MQWAELKFGSVIFFKDFEFADGGASSDKLFICVGKRELEAVVAITTSQAPKTNITPGCASQRGLYLLRRTATNKLDKDTYVILPKLGIVYPTMMKEKRFQEARVILALPEHEAHDIKNCIAYCEDVAPAYKRLLGPPPAKK